MNDVKSIPKTLDEAVLALDEVLDAKDQVTLIACDRSQLSRYHHGLGRWMRNNWGLWTGKPLCDHMRALGFTHPDDMSQTIIVEYWNRKNNKPSTITEDVARYAEFWKKSTP